MSDKCNSLLDDGGCKQGSCLRWVFWDMFDRKGGQVYAWFCEQPFEFRREYSEHKRGIRDRIRQGPGKE